MPKMKTRKAATKRFSLTGTGKVKRSKAFKNHILTSKSAKRKRNLRGTTTVHKSQEQKIKLMIAS